MFKANNENHHRFFSDSSIYKEKTQSLDKDDPTPFGLNFQENFSLKENSPEDGVTMGASVTRQPGGSDTTIDVDF